MSDELLCRNTTYKHACDSRYLQRYNGYCLDCANAGVDDRDEEIARLRARVAELEHNLVAAQSYRQDYAQAVDQMLAAEKRVAELEAAARPFARGYEYADAELSGRADRDSLSINPYDPDSPTYGDCRRLAALLEKPQ